MRFKHNNLSNNQIWKGTSMYMLCVNPIQQQSSLQQDFSPTCTILLDQKKNTWTVEDWSVCMSLLIRSTPTRSNSALLLCLPPPN